MGVSVSLEPLLVLLLATMRVSAFLAVAPPFNSRAVPARVKAALALGLALVVVSSSRPMAPALDLPGLLGAAVYQVAVGLAMGFVVQVAMAVVQAAGELVDLASGFTLATLYDPLSNVSSSMFGRIHQLLAVTLLFALNGHLLLVRGLVTTFEVVPIGTVSLGDLTRLVTKDLGRFLVGALEVAAPVLVVLFLAELALGLVSRAVPTLNILALGFPVKIMLAITLSAVAVALLPGTVSALLDRAAQDMAVVARALGSAS